MNPELFNPVTVTAAASVVGYAVGYGIERKAVKNAAEAELEWNQQMGIAAEAAQAEPLPRATRYANKMLAPLALSGAVAVGLAAYSFYPDNNATIEKPGVLELVVDHSGATANVVDGDSIVSRIDKIAGQFKDTTMHVNVVVAKAGEEKTISLDQLGSAEAAPFGTANLPTITSNAISRAAAAVPVNVGDRLQRNAAVFVITNGNSVGNAKSVIAQSQKAYGSTIKTPVFIVNEEGADASKEDLAAFKQIAKDTNGQYWSADKDNLDTVVEQVKEAIVATQTTGNSAPNKWPLRALSLVALAGMYVAYKRRGQMPFGRGIKGE